MNVGELMNAQVVYCRLEETLAEASRKITHGRHDSLPVCEDDGRLTGVLDARSICIGAQVARRPLEDILVRDVFIEHGPVCRVDDEAAEVAQRMLHHGLRSMAIVDTGQHLVGQVFYETVVASTDRRETLVRLVDGSLDPWITAAPFPGWTYLTDRRELISAAGERRSLSVHEGCLLSCFAAVPRQVVDRDYLMRAVCNRRWCSKDRYIDVLVGTLRRKLDERAAAARLIRTVHGVGYLFDAHVVGANVNGGPIRPGRADPPGGGAPGNDAASGGGDMWQPAPAATA